jgi:hypothetical protein
MLRRTRGGKRRAGPADGQPAVPACSAARWTDAGHGRHRDLPRTARTVRSRKSGHRAAVGHRRSELATQRNRSRRDLLRAEIHLSRRPDGSAECAPCRTRPAAAQSQQKAAPQRRLTAARCIAPSGPSQRAESRPTERVMHHTAPGTADLYRYRLHTAGPSDMPVRQHARHRTFLSPRQQANHTRSLSHLGRSAPHGVRARCRILFLDVRTQAEVSYVGAPHGMDANIPFMLVDFDHFDTRTRRFTLHRNPAFVRAVDARLAARGSTGTPTSC